MISEVDENGEILAPGKPDLIVAKEPDAATNVGGTVVRPDANHSLQGVQQALQSGAAKFFHFGTGDIHYHIEVKSSDSNTASHHVKEWKQALEATPSGIRGSGHESDGSSAMARSSSEISKADVKPVNIIEPTIQAGLVHCGEGDLNVGTGAGKSCSRGPSPGRQGEPGKTKISITQRQAESFIEKVNQNTIKNTEHDVRSTFKNLKQPERNVYPGLSLVNLSEEIPSKGLESEYIPNATYNFKPGVDERPVTIQCLHEKECHHAMLLGDAGDGKTTAAMRYATLALGGEVETLKNVKLVHFVKASKLHVQETTAFELLFMQQVCASSGITGELAKDGKLWVLKNPEKVLMIIDGLDQCAHDFDKDYANIAHDSKAKPNAILHNLFRGWIYPGMWILSTTRWHVYWKMATETKPARTIALRGYDYETIEYLLVSFIGEKGLQILNHLKKKSPILLSLCEIPMFLVFVSEVVTQELDDLPDSLSSILVSVLCCFISSVHRSSSIPELLNKLMSMAFNGIKDKKVLFSHTYVTSMGLDVDDIRDLVITDAAPERYQFRVLDGDKELYFCHQSIQEVLAALHICNMNANDLKESLATLLEEPHMEVVRKLVYGILLNDKTSKKAKKLLKGMPPSESISKTKIAVKRAKSLIQKKRVMDVKTLSLLHECGQSICSTYDSIQEINLTNTLLKPSDVHAVLSITQNCHQLRSICFGNVCLDSKSIQPFRKCLDGTHNIELRSLQITGSFSMDDKELTRFWDDCLSAGATKLFLNGCSVSVTKKKELDVVVNKVLTSLEVRGLFAVLKTRPVSSVLLTCILSSEFLTVFSKGLKDFRNMVDVVIFNESKIVEAPASVPLLLQRNVGKLSLKYCDVEIVKKKVNIRVKSRLTATAFMVIAGVLNEKKASAVLTEFASLDSILLMMASCSVKLQNIEINLKVPGLKTENRMLCNIHLDFMHRSTVQIATNHSRGNRTFLYLIKLVRNCRVEQLKLYGGVIQFHFNAQHEMKSLTFVEYPSEDRYLDFITETGVDDFTVQQFNFTVERDIKGGLPCLVLDESMISSDCAHALWRSTKACEVDLKVKGLNLRAVWDNLGRITHLGIAVVRSGQLQTLQSVTDRMADLAHIKISGCFIDTADEGQALDQVNLLKEMAVYHSLEIERLEVGYDVTNITKGICDLLEYTKLKVAIVCGTEYRVRRYKDGKTDVLYIMGGITHAQHLIDIVQNARIAVVSSRDFLIKVVSTPSFKSLQAKSVKIKPDKSYATLVKFMMNYGANTLKVDNFLLTRSHRKGMQRVNLLFDVAHEQEENSFTALCDFVVNSGVDRMKINDVSFTTDTPFENKFPAVQVDVLKSENIALMSQIFTKVKVSSVKIRRYEIMNKRKESLDQYLTELQQISKQTDLQVHNIDVKGFSHIEAGSAFRLLGDIRAERVRFACLIDEDMVNIVQGEAGCSIDRINIMNLPSFLEGFKPQNMNSILVKSCYLQCNIGQTLYAISSVADQLHILSPLLVSRPFNVEIACFEMDCDALNIMSDVMEFMRALKIHRLHANGLTFSVEYSDDENRHLNVEYLCDMKRFIVAMQDVQVQKITINKLLVTCETSDYIIYEDTTCETNEDTTFTELLPLQHTWLQNVVILELEIETSFYADTEMLVEFVKFHQVNVIKTRDFELGIDHGSESMVLEAPEIPMDKIERLVAVLKNIDADVMKIARCQVGPVHRQKIEDKLKAIEELSATQLKLMMEILYSTGHEQTKSELQILQSLIDHGSMRIEIGSFEMQESFFGFSGGLLNMMASLKVRHVKTPFDEFSIKYTDDDEHILSLESVSTCDLAKVHEVVDGTSIQHVVVDKYHISSDEPEQGCEAASTILEQDPMIEVNGVMADCALSDISSALVRLIRQSHLKYVKLSDLELEIRHDSLGKCVSLKVAGLSVLARNKDFREFVSGAKYLQIGQCFLELCGSPLEIKVHHTKEDTIATMSEIIEAARFAQARHVRLQNMTLFIQYNLEKQMKSITVEEVNYTNWKHFMHLMQGAGCRVIVDYCHFEQPKFERIDDLESAFVYDSDASALEIKNLHFATLSNQLLGVLRQYYDCAEVGTVYVSRYVIETLEENCVPGELQTLQNLLLYEHDNVKIDTLQIQARFCSVKDEVIHIADNSGLRNLDIFEGECHVIPDTEGKVSGFVLPSLHAEDMIDISSSEIITNWNIKNCIAPLHSIPLIVDSPLPQGVQIQTVDVECRFESIPDLMKILSVVKPECLQTYDGPVRVKYDGDGKVHSLDFHCMGIISWQKYLKTLCELGIPCLGIDRLVIQPALDENPRQSIDLAEQLAADKAVNTKIRCIDFQSKCAKNVDALLSIAMRTHTRNVKTSDVVFLTELCPDDETMCITVPELQENNLVGLLADLLDEHNSDVSDVNMLLVKLEAYMTSKKIKLKIASIRSAKNFNDVSRPLMMIARLVLIQNISSLDGSVCLSYGQDAKVEVIKVSSLCQEQVKFVSEICKEKGIRKLVIGVWLSKNGDAFDKIKLFRESLSNNDTSIEIGTVKMSTSLYDDAAAYMKGVEEFHVDQLMTSDGVFDFQYGDGDVEVSGVQASDLSSYNLSNFIGIFGQTKSVFIEEFHLKTESKAHEDIEKEIIHFMNILPVEWKIGHIKLRDNLIDITDVVKLLLGRFGDVQTMDSRVCKYGEVKIVEMYDSSCDAGQIAKITAKMKPDHIKLVEYELELKYYDNGMAQMTAVLNHRLGGKVCEDLKSIASQADIDLVQVMDCHLRRHECNKPKTSTVPAGVGYDYFTEYTPQESTIDEGYLGLRKGIKVKQTIPFHAVQRTYENFQPVVDNYDDTYSISTLLYDFEGLEEVLYEAL